MRRSDVIAGGIGNPYLRGWQDAMNGMCAPQVPYKTAIAAAWGGGMPRPRAGTWADPRIMVGPPVATMPTVQQPGGVMVPVTDVQTGPAMPASVLYENMRANSYYFAVDSDEDVVAGDTVEVPAQPQEPCVPLQMTVEDSIAATFGIVQITIGVTPVFISATGTGSMSIFKSDSTSPKFRSVLLTPGKLYTATVENLSGGDERFIATVTATAVA